jgi:Lon protease-like protein
VAALVNLLAMMCPFEPREKQALLEAQTLVERARVLRALLDLDAASTVTAGNRLQ